nr:hypothetical protein HRbin03_00097 [Ipomoea batatas]GMD67078.1 hypothetical protein HRbin03_00097 [Ipomoea batatas]
MVFTTETKNANNLIISDTLSNLHHVLVKSTAHIIEIREDKRPRNVKTTGDDVLGVLPGQPLALLYRQILPHTLLVIGQLNYKWHLKRILQVLGEHEWNEMTHMQGFRRRSTASIQVEFIPSFISIQNLTEVAMSEEDAAAEENVGLAAGESLHAVNEGLFQPLAAELVNQLVVVDFAAVLG